MNSKKKICVVTGTRAEFGLLYWLVKGIQDDPDLELQLIATGMHLSPEFGLTYHEIEKAGFDIDYKVEMLLSGDTPASISKSTGLGLIGFADAYNKLNPGLVIVLGDRFEIFAASSAALFANIPIAHIHGGETTAGAFDEALRHSITKMAALHFVAAEPYRKRVIQLGENPKRVFNVGGLGVEAVNKLSLLSKKELERTIGLEFGKKNLLVTFHPVTLESNTSQQQFKNLLAAISRLDDTKVIFTKANSDTDGRIINKLIDDYVVNNSDTSVAFTSMGQLKYLSTMQFVDAVVGNSSSGLLEAPSFGIGTINIGDRQKGRIMSGSVINCEPDVESIGNALRLLFSDEFRNGLNKVKNPFDGGKTSESILNIIKSFSIQYSHKKEFYDLLNER